MALNKPVTIVAGADKLLLPAPSTNVITDGVFLAETTAYLASEAVDKAIHWNTSTAEGTVFEIQLGGFYRIDGIIAQADDNDALSVSYLHANNTFQPLYSVQYASVGWGFRTRPSGDQTTWSPLSPVITSAIRVTNTYGDGYFGISELQLRGVPSTAVDAQLIGQWVADDLTLGNSGNWTSRVNGTVAQIDRGSPQVNTGGGFNGHKYVTFNPSNPTDTSAADTFSIAAGSASHPSGLFSITVVFRMPTTASGSGSTASGNWYENVGLVGMEVAGAPTPPDWIFGIDNANHLSGAGVRGTSAVNSNKVIIATVSYTETEQLIHVNGVLEGQFAMGRTTSLTTTPYAFGANRASGGRGGTGFDERFFAGDIAEIRIHGSVVNAQAEFAALQAIYCPPPRIVSFEKVETVPRISFTTAEGCFYRVERSDLLTEGSWTPVTGAESVPGTGGVVQISDPAPGAGTLPRRFYRVALLP